MKDIRNSLVAGVRVIVYPKYCFSILCVCIPPKKPAPADYCRRAGKRKECNNMSSMNRGAVGLSNLDFS